MISFKDAKTRFMVDFMKFSGGGPPKPHFSIPPDPPKGIPPPIRHQISAREGLDAALLEGVCILYDWC